MSTTLVTARAASLGTNIVACGALAVLAATVLLVLCGGPTLKDRSARALRDPGFMVSTAFFAFFAVTPLAWGHYYLLLLLPALTCLNSTNRLQLGLVVGGILVLAQRPLGLLQIYGADHSLVGALHHHAVMAHVVGRTIAFASR
ncbi:MAG: hypothetical protein HOI95_25750 [Chromatiales bacterium]|nr:hypothetical protein [Chromatiales bacterium]